MSEIPAWADKAAARQRSDQIASNALREAEAMLREVLARGPSLQPVVRLSHLDCQHSQWANHTGVSSCLVCGVLETQINDGADLAYRLRYQHQFAQGRAAAGPVAGDFADLPDEYLESLGAMDDRGDHNQSVEGWR